MEATGGAPPRRRFNGEATTSGTPGPRSTLAARGGFLTQVSGAARLFRISGTGTASDGDYHIAAVAGDGQSLTLTSAPAAPGTYTAVLSRIVNRGLYTGSIAYNAAAGTLTRTDGTSWLDDGFLEGQLFMITGLSGATALYKINTISGTAANLLNVITLTGQFPLLSSGIGTLTLTQWAAVATFTPSNWYLPQTVNLLADTYFNLPPGRENIKTFAKQPHLLSGIRGPLPREGGATGADRSRQPAVLLPLEKNGPLFAIAPQAPEAQQVDVLNIFDDSSHQDKTGELSATAITGLGMAGQLDFSDYGNTQTAFG